MRVGTASAASAALLLFVFFAPPALWVLVSKEPALRGPRAQERRLTTQVVFDGCQKSGEAPVAQVIAATSTSLSSTPNGAKRSAIATRCCREKGASLECKSKKPGGQCLPKGVDYATAARACEAIGPVGDGWGLCTQAQLLTGKCCGTGCRYDHFYTWTAPDIQAPAPAPGPAPASNLCTADGCRAKAIELGLPFSTQRKSNGAPAGCMRYNDGRVIFVETCSNHPVCGTTNCNGCKVLKCGSGQTTTTATATTTTTACQDVISGQNNASRCHESWICSDEWWKTTHCRATCGVCGSGQTTTTATATTTTTACQDVISGQNNPSRCHESWICSDEWWKTTHCRATCGVCGTPPPPPPTQKCVDKRSDWRDDARPMRHTCEQYAKLSDGRHCERYGREDYGKGTANDVCCACGGGKLPTAASLPVPATEFYAEWLGHPLSQLRAIIEGLRSSGIVWLAGDSSLDNKHWLFEGKDKTDPRHLEKKELASDAIRGYKDLLEPPRMVRDVAFWLNAELANSDSGHHCVNTAVEASTVRKHSKGEYEHDELIRDNLLPDDFVVVSVGSNDVVREALTSREGVARLEDLMGSKGTEKYARAMEHFVGIFKNKTETYIRRLTARHKPRAVVVSMIYFPDEKRGTALNQTNTFLEGVGYNLVPILLQGVIRDVYEKATKEVYVEGTLVIPLPLFTVLDGKSSSDYLMRIEPSDAGGRKIAQAIWQEILKFQPR